MKYLLYTVIAVAVLFLIVVLLPLLILLVLVAAFFQLLTGRQYIRMHRWARQGQQRRERQQAAADNPEYVRPEVPACQDIIDAEVIELPDDTAAVDPEPGDRS